MAAKGTCPACGTKNRSGAKFCSKCGQPLAAKEGKDQEPRAFTLAKQIGAVAAAIAAVLGLLFLLWPSLKPVEPTSFSATISNVSIEPNVSFGESLDRSNQPSAGFTRDQLDMNGAMASFEVRIQGFKGRKCPLTWSIYDAQTNQQVEERVLIDQAAVTFIPEVADDRASGQIWVQFPSRVGTYKVRLQLYDDKGVQLTYADGEEVTVR